MDKTITLKKSLLYRLLFSLLIGFGILFILEHFGEISHSAIGTPVYSTDGRRTFYSEVDLNAPLSNIYYESFFKNHLSTGGNGFTVSDMRFSDSEFYDYSNQVYYYAMGMKLDFVYGLLFSFILFFVFYITSTYKFKIQ